MKALILNSGRGMRMGGLSLEHPKCMTKLSPGETILSRQLKQLVNIGISDVIITTGYLKELLVDYCIELNLPLNIMFTDNPRYEETNYIYSIYCARKLLDDDILLMHGDLVFEDAVLDKIFNCNASCTPVSSALSLPDKDFKAVVDNGIIKRVGVEFFENAVAAQPLYKLLYADLTQWLDRIIIYCENGNVNVYAENALNELDGACNIKALDIQDKVCHEIDTAEDLQMVSEMINNGLNYVKYKHNSCHRLRKVYNNLQEVQNGKYYCKSDI